MENQPNLTRKPSKLQIERLEYIRKFVAKNHRQPTLKEIAEHYRVSIPTAWETVERIGRNINVCKYCGHDL